MATSVPSYTTASRHCQQLADSPAPSPGPSSAFRDWCPGHSPLLGKPDSGRQLLADAGKLLGEFQVSQLFPLRAIRRYARSCCATAPLRQDSELLHCGERFCSCWIDRGCVTGLRRAESQVELGDVRRRWGGCSHDPREQRPVMTLATREQLQSWPRRRRNGRRNPDRDPDSRGPHHPGKPAVPTGQPWW